MNFTMLGLQRGFRRPALVAVGLAAGFVAVSHAAAGNWAHWRGPFFNGSTTETNLPASFSKTENVRWAAAMPGPAASTPIVWEDRVFVSSTDAAAGQLLALALDRRSGQQLWRRVTGERASRDHLSNYASPSPVADAERVIFFYGSGELVAFNHAGEPQWARNLCADFGEFAFLWTFAASPLLLEDRLIIQVLQRDVPVNGRGRAGGPIESYLLAVDPRTGKDLWKVTRPSEAVAESREAFTSPVPFTHAGRLEILVVGGDCLTGHDPATGRELWRWGTWNPSRIGHWRLVPSPVAGGGVVLACGPKAAPVFAIEAGGRGELDDSHIAWSSRDERDVTTDVPTPLFYLGDFFILSDLKKTLARVDPATGRVKWKIETPGNAKYEASPTGADGRIFLLNFRGEVVVVDAADGRVTHQVSMGEPGDDRTRSTIVAARNHLFIRANQKLYCIGRGD
jgi:outer membrane protein assembly factor BamB